METEGDLRKSIAKFRRSIYGGDEVDFVDIFRFDIDEEDHKEILSMMGVSLSRLPDNLKGKVVSKFLTGHPELKGHIDEDEGEDKMSEDHSFDTLSTSRWTEFHEEFVRELQSLASTFSTFDPEKLWGMVRDKQRPYYELVRVYAIQKVGNDTNSSLHIIHKLNKCKTQDIKLSNCEHFHIFSWTEDRFMARRQMKGIAWLDIFQKSLTDEAMEAFKFQVDIIELVRLLKPILLNFYSENKEFGENAVQTIRDAFNLVHIDSTIQHELEDNVALICDRINVITNISMKRRSDGRDIVKNFLELETMASWVRDPIENRYHIKSTQERTADWKDHFAIKEKRLKLELKKAKRKCEVEMYCYRNMMQAMYGTIEDYKRRIAAMTVEYDRRLTEVNEQNTTMKMSMEKMKMQREYLDAEKEYMTARIKEILADSRKGKPTKGKRSPRKLTQMSLLRKSLTTLKNLKKNNHNSFK